MAVSKCALTSYHRTLTCNTLILRSSSPQAGPISRGGIARDTRLAGGTEASQGRLAIFRTLPDTENGIPEYGANHVALFFAWGVAKLWAVSSNYIPLYSCLPLRSPRFSLAVKVLEVLRPFISLLPEVAKPERKVKKDPVLHVV